MNYLEFSPRQIGELSAILLATKIIAPNIWGWIADHTGKRVWIIRLAIFAGMIIFSAVLITNDYWPLLLALAGFSFFWNAALPQFEAATINNLFENKHLYSRIRLWGSVGFVAASLLLAPILQIKGIGLLPWMILIMLFCVWVNTLFVHDVTSKHTNNATESLLEACFKPQVVALLLACFLIQASHGPYYAFFSIYLEEHDYQRTTIGQLWAFGVIAEVFIFYWAHNLLPRFGAKFLLAIAMMLTVVRWWLIAVFVDRFEILLIAQLLHAASYGLFHAAAIYLIDQYFSGSIQGRGQALYSSVSFGLGGSLGSLMSGYTWNLIGPSNVYLLAMGIASIAFIQFIWIVKPRFGQC